MLVDRRVLTAIQMLALLCAIGASGYLAYQKATNGVPLCTVGGGCMAALYSPWGYLFGIPLAYIGLTAATVLLIATPWLRYEVRAVSFALLLIGALFEIYLRYVEQAHFGGHVCMWCVSFMVFWWIAGASELLRLIRWPADAEAATA